MGHVRDREALLLRERAGEGEVVVVTVGDEEAEGLLTCLAKGADRGVRIAVDDPAELDPIAVARLLAEIVAREKPPLVLCGVQSSDASNGATGVALAGLAGLPRVAVVKRSSGTARSVRSSGSSRAGSSSACASACPRC